MSVESDPAEIEAESQGVRTRSEENERRVETQQRSGTSGRRPGVGAGRSLSSLASVGDGDGEI